MSASFLCPGVFCLCRTHKFDNQLQGLFYPYIFLGVGDIFLLYFDGSVWTGLGSPGSLSCTLRIF